MRPVRTITALAFIIVASLCCLAVAEASCGPADPTGYYEGTAQSKEAGALKVTMNLRCDGRRYNGSIVTPVGTFAIVDGSYTNGTLSLQFGGGAINDRGTLNLQINGDSAIGSFKLAADSGSFALTRLGDAHVLASVTPDLDITRQQWHEDLRFLMSELTTKHVQPFAYTSRQTLLDDSAALDRQLGTLNFDEIYMGMDHIANLIGDGHTYVEFPPDLALFPMQLQRFNNDYRVIEATGEGKNVLGMRVVAIDGVRIQKAHDELLAAITPIGETKILRDVRAQNFLTIGMALHGIGIISERDRATYTIEDDSGRVKQVTLNALSPAQADAAQWKWAWQKRPLFHQRRDDDFWYTYLPHAKAVYLSFRGYENLPSLAPRFMDFVKTKRPAKVIVDLRLNSGGDYKAGLKYLVDPIAALYSINRTGHLFVLVGPNTFSAAMSNAAQFRTKTHALLVGQTIGERPNSNQEANEERLPNSHLLLRYSTRHYAFLPGKINEIVPDKQIIPAWPPFRSGRDPVLEWALAAY